jgi:hypothetical protein
MKKVCILIITVWISSFIYSQDISNKVKSVVVDAEKTTMNYVCVFYGLQYSKDKQPIWYLSDGTVSGSGEIKRDDISEVMGEEIKYMNVTVIFNFMDKKGYEYLDKFYDGYSKTDYFLFRKKNYD